ncbi:MAG: trypsin-like peptidase domain-containing protein [Thermoanaerobaculia bacterium]|nr:trypsin-like peptidase domain-containing protein [Thermoanaerobaculia bacterium]MBP9823802.1 trypsin-like peptidase domain-containing protein [Thermoanaerobaculia bacterium]
MKPRLSTRAVVRGPAAIPAIPAIAALAIFAAVAALAPALAAAAPRELSHGELLARMAPAIVSVKVVLKTEFNMGDSMQEQESVLDALGAVVDPDGLILLWNSQLSASRLMDAVRQMGEGEEFRIKMTPTDFRVTFAGDPREHRAFLAASDSELDLAFLQLEEKPERPLPSVEFGRSRPTEIGDTVVGVSRLSPAFDRAAYFETGRIAGRIAKPAAAFILDASPALLGLPVFDLQGRAVGAVATVLSRVSEPSTQGGDMMSYFALGRGRMESGPLGVFLLPGERVQELVSAARLRARELLAERQPASPSAAE